jgi:hypothetical protein
MAEKKDFKQLDFRKAIEKDSADFFTDFMDILKNIDASLSIISLYYEKKGIKEGLFKETDISGE